jgi:hypothetical protein
VQAGDIPLLNEEEQSVATEAGLLITPSKVIPFSKVTESHANLGKEILDNSLTK